MNIETTVRLQPHIGVQETQLGPAEVDLGQYLVMAQTEHTGFRWVHLGYICKPTASNPHPPFNGLDNFRTLPPALKEQIAAQVRRELGVVSMAVTEPPEPIVIEEEEYDDTDE